MRLDVSQAESKRHFENYVKVRNQLNQVFEQQELNQSGAKSSRDTTPKGGLKGNKTTVDDVLIASKDYEQHLKEVAKFHKICKVHNITLNRQKISCG